MTTQEALAAIEGLTFADCTNFFYEKATERDKQIAGMVECDDDFACDGAIISEGDDNGAFVMCWQWVSFAGTDLDKDKDEDEDEDETTTELVRGMKP